MLASIGWEDVWFDVEVGGIVDFACWRLLRLLVDDMNEEQYGIKLQMCLKGECKW